MNCAPKPETRREYIRVGSTPASMLVTVSDSGAQSLSLKVNGTAVMLTLNDAEAYVRQITPENIVLEYNFPLNI